MDVLPLATKLIGMVLPRPAHDVSTRSSVTDAALRERADGSTSVASESFRRILERYDVRNISLREFSALVQELQAAGAISDADLAELALIRLEIENACADPDEALNLIAIVEEKLREREEELNWRKRTEGADAVNRQISLRPIERQLAWLRKFAAIHDDTRTSSLNVLG